MELFEIRRELETISEKLEQFRGSLDIAGKLAELKELDTEMSAPDFWNDADSARNVSSKHAAIQKQVQQFEAMTDEVSSMQETLELIKQEPDDEMQELLADELTEFMEKFTAFELDTLLSGPYDSLNAILEIHPGAGGTESQDWAQMLMRMYTRWAESHNYKVEILDYLAGDEAGLKSATLRIAGFNAYGYLRSERGVHRLVRISPFDSSGRRHTSFASIAVMPEIDDTISLDIDENDLKIDTYRSSGAGGQSVNTTDSAVRITHIPTGIVVTCQNERSQIKNREMAMKLLRSKIYEKRVEEQEAELVSIAGEKKNIAWGSQIRSYVFHPYSMVKDHRTNAETGNVNAVMDGDIDQFIDQYLKFINDID
ncbi:peptide chain release factor 2 [Culicoidibacter larvae]|uniref:Peptide chain release factor 2 n=1 Tax=Culicoidibacter larvae TaxID=2579976 RepID=A0A5R8QAP9_9FIRM|nr:peptide chain release factor 2 [Culicoidibacter larvae]TLG72705.1 peptide chain release factor 2 [Culicoidibacter larvae]